MNINSKQDCSYLFSSLGSGAASAAGSNFLSDYASIKNGSYGKLMKAYYGKSSANDSVNSIVNKNSTSKDNSATISKVKDASDSLKDSADALLSKSLFKEVDITTKDENGVETTSKGYDVDAIYKSVSNFVKDYNSVMSAAKSAKSNSITNSAKNIAGYTEANKNMLSKIGITINSDKTLSIDEDAFRKSDMKTVKNLFNNSGSYGYRVSSQASMLNLAAEREAGKTNTYGAKGNFTNNYNSGNMFNNYF